MKKVLRSPQALKPSSVARALAVAGLVTTATAAASAPGFCFPSALDPQVAVAGTSVSSPAAPVTLAEFRARLEVRAIEADAVRATAPLGDTLRWVLAELPKVNGNGRAVPVATPGPDYLLTAQDVAQRLHCSTRLIYARARTWPFTVRDGRLVRFSAAGVERWL